MGEELGLEYARREAEAGANRMALGRRGRQYGVAAGMAVLLLVVLGVDAIKGHASAWPAGVMAAVAAGALLLYVRSREREYRAARLEAYYRRGKGRMRGEVAEGGPEGEAFAEEGHLYERDLQVLGPRSLFSLLATTRTVIGQRGLAGYLLRPVEAAEARQRQAAVQELAPQVDLRERIGLLGRWEFQQLPAEMFERWLDAEPSDFPRWTHVVLPLLTLAWLAYGVVGLLAGVDHDLLLQNIAALLAVQAGFCLWLRPRVQAELAAAQKMAGQTLILREGLRLLRETAFGAERLQTLQKEAAGEDAALRQLERWLDVLEQRGKDWFFALALLLAAGSEAALGLDAWKRAHAEEMRAWLGTWAEFEALVAVGTYAAEHPENMYPEIVDDGEVAVLTATALRHPLLAIERAVANDVTLGPASLEGAAQWLMISGSNMAGKSTLLRTVGANAVLALAGAPVPAERMRMCAVRLGASLAVQDSLAEGKSKFLAEVERLRAMVAEARGHPGRMLFLIDEIFSGTNSLDRRAAAEPVLRALVAAGGVGAVSTHDLTLTGIGELPGLNGRNVHMASPHEEEPLAFDYLLKDGVNRTTNALAIVRMLGLG